MHVEISFEAKANPPLYFSKQGTNHLVSWKVSTFYVQHLSEVAAAGYSIYWTFHSPSRLWGKLRGDPGGHWLAILGDLSLTAADSSALDRQPRLAATAHGAPPKKTGPAGV